jgi:hypothetical protein
MMVGLLTFFANQGDKTKNRQQAVFFAGAR